MAEVPDGIDVDNVTAWLAERAEVVPPLVFATISGGRSNLTYTVEDTAGGRWVLRRPPLFGALPSAHDMGREHRIITALAGTDVPVPPAVGFCDDQSVNGAPFYVMEHVDGIVLRDAAAARSVDAEVRQRSAESLVEVLARLHAVDPDAVGLGDLGRKEDYVARQLRRWHGQLHKQKTRELGVLDEVHGRLVSDIPEQGPAAIVHGDYRLDNVMVDAAGEVVAVLDWELCTLGDPMADLGLLMVYWAQEGDEQIPLLDAPTVVDPYPRRDEIAARYAELSGRDISELPYYEAFGFWKLAIILEGVYARFASGAYGEVPPEHYQVFADVVVMLGDRALAAAKEAGR